VALTTTAKHVGENHKIGFEAHFTLRLAGHIEMYFPVFLFVISGFCLIFGWMLFLAESLSSLWKYFFLPRIHCSVYIINSLLAANCISSWAPYLFDCKPRLKSFFSSFHAAYIFYFYLSKGIDDAQGVVFPWLRFVDQIIFSLSIFFSITCTSVTGGIMINRRQL